MTDLTRETAKGLHHLLERGEVSAVEVTNAHLDRIAATDTHIGAWLAMMADDALAHATDVDTRRAKKAPVGALAGVPVGIKDLMCTKGVPTTAGSKMLETYRPPFNATVVENLRNADAIALGKLNMDEFAMGSSTETSAYGLTHNPWDLDRIPGGSSGGSSAAVAAFQVPLATGTDTGGSIRQPASVCGVVGIKPTYGRASRYGLVAFASSLDQAGMFARTVEDVAWSLEVMCSHDSKDATSLPDAAGDFTTGLDQGIEGMRIGYVPEHLGEGCDPSVADATRHALTRLEALGAEIVEIQLPFAQYGLAAYYIIAPAEASSNLARHDGVRWGTRVDGATTAEMMANTRSANFGPEVQRRIMIGTHVLSAGSYDEYFGRAQRTRTLIINDFANAFNDLDVIVTPTAPSPAFKLNDATRSPLAMYLSDIYSVPASLAGLPGMSVPVGFADGEVFSQTEGLPIGLQLVGKPMAEATILRVAAALEADLALDLAPRGANALEG
ncbi:Asp-tRNA(Asn)/Glu-tRNA(Gln) amidotransferase subunit GatA [Stomatohabitans albus]|uniref:Asp-tRNA(Asn)/Glu-tRNA(Gln) amidotransferase subunit GatA n=1 Tax=Stomatohabitans albus TaxID=3110766 RepID=UPI00300D0988